MNITYNFGCSSSSGLQICFLNRFVETFFSNTQNEYKIHNYEIAKKCFHSLYNKKNQKVMLQTSKEETLPWVLHLSQIYKVEIESFKNEGIFLNFENFKEILIRL